MNTRTKTQALKALDGMEMIVRNEMVAPGEYVSGDVVDPKLAADGAICGGHQTCAIGSLWIGAGIKMERNEWHDVFLPGVQQEQRQEFLQHRHGLRAAYDALNAAAGAYIDRCGYDRKRLRLFDADIEVLFESTECDLRGFSTRRGATDTPLVTRGQLLRIIKSAKGRLLRKV